MGHSFFFPRWRFWAPAFTLSGRQTTSSGISRWPPESTRTGRRCRGARRVRRRNCTWGRRRAMLAAGSGGLAPTGRKGNSHIPGSEALGLSFLRGGEEFLDLLRRWHPCSARHSGRRTPTVVLWVVGRFTRLLVAVVSRRRRLSPELATKKNPSETSCHLAMSTQGRITTELQNLSAHQCRPHPESLTELSSPQSSRACRDQENETGKKA
jgi:hypothetical protein